MASLVLGAVGGFFFGPIGFMAGSMIGNLLFPTGPDQQGPRLNDLKLQSSTYGAMIPWIYGTMRISGQVIWQTDLTEHTNVTGGKGGGPEVTTYTYSASFAVMLCQGEIVGIRRIWATDGTLIYDTTENATVDNSQVPMTIYYGTEDQDPDPTMESVLLAGNVPAYRGYAYVVFTDWELGNFGNQIPNLSFEVYTAAGSIPWRVSYFEPGGGRPLAGVTYTDGVIKFGQYYNAGGHVDTYRERSYLVDGTEFGSPSGWVESPMQSIDGWARTEARVINLQMAFAWGDADPPHRAGWFSGPNMIANVVSHPNYDNSNLQDAVTGFPLYQSHAIYGIWNNSTTSVSGIAKWPAPDGVPEPLSSASTSYTFGSYAVPNPMLKPSNMIIGSSDDGKVYVRDNGAVDPNDVILYEFDEDLTLLRSWAVHNLPVEFIASPGSWGTYRGMIWFLGGAVGSMYMILYTLADSVTEAEFVGSLIMDGSTNPFWPGGNEIRIHHGLVVGEEGIVSLDPPVDYVRLSDIVADLSRKAGLSDGSPNEFDVSELTDMVPGYFVTSRSSCRSDIEPLRAAYFFDAVESDGCVRFVKRGKPVDVDIPTTDLAAHQAGSGLPSAITLRRMQEHDLPQSVSVKYFDIDVARQQGNQYARRMVTLSQSVTDLDLPLALNAKMARQIASTHLYSAWYERDSYSIRTTRKYEYLEPTDTITASGYTIRIVSKKDIGGGVMEFDGVRSLGTLYVAAPSGADTLGGQQTQPAAPQATNGILLDLPLVVDSDIAPGAYVAAAGSVDETWSSAQLFKSVDSGVTYSIVNNLTSASTIGESADELGDFYGGNVFDELNSVTVVIGIGGGTLSSTNTEAVLGGANMASLGYELIQYKRAELVAARTYKLTGLLRGRRGTEWATGTHSAGDLFVALPVTNIQLTTDDLDAVRYWKAVSRNQTLAGTTAFTNINRGEALKPYTPVHLGGGPIYNAGSFDGTVQINWIARNRINGAWKDFVDVPPGDGIGFGVLIWNSDYTLCARIDSVLGYSYTYTASMQIADFGATQSRIYFSVLQIGDTRLGRQARGSVLGTGASDDDPLNPITPIED